MKKILAAMESYNTAIRVIPAVKRLMERGRVKVQCYSTLRGMGHHPDARDTLVNLIQGSGLPLFTTLGEHRWDDEIERAKDEYQKAYGQAIAQLPPASQPVFHSMLIGKYVFGHLLSDNQHKIEFHSMFKGVLTHTAPDLLITGYDQGGLKRWLTHVAKRMGIPSLGLQYGAWPYLRSRRASDYFALWGEAFREVHTREYHREDQLFVTGSPHFDPYTGPNPFDREGLLRGLSLDPGRRTVIFGVAALSMEEELTLLLKKLAGRRDIQLIIKLHPEVSPERRAQYQQILQGADCLHAMVQAEGPQPAALLKASDLLVSTTSNFIQEGLALGVDLVLYCHRDFFQVNEFGVKSPIIFASDRYSHTAWDKDELVRAVEHALAHPGQLVQTEEAQYHRHRLWYKLDGLAGERTAQLAEQLAGAA